jgi:hypothetical protein
VLGKDFVAAHTAAVGCMLENLAYMTLAVVADTAAAAVVAGPSMKVKRKTMQHIEVRQA